MSKLLVPVVPPTFYAIGSNYKNHVVGRAEVKGTAPKFYERPRVGYRANSALIRDRRRDRQAEGCWRQFRI